MEALTKKLEPLQQKNNSFERCAVTRAVTADQSLCVKSFTY